MTPSRLSNLRDLWPHLSDIERELLQEVERLQNQPPGLKLHASCLTIEAALRTALDAVNRELEEAKERERQLEEAILESWCEEVYEIPQDPYLYCVYCRNDAMSSKENIKHRESCVAAKLLAEAALTVPPAKEKP